MKEIISTRLEHSCFDFERLSVGIRPALSRIVDVEKLLSKLSFRIPRCKHQRGVIVGPRDNTKYFRVKVTELSTIDFEGSIHIFTLFQ